MLFLFIFISFFHSAKDMINSLSVPYALSYTVVLNEKYSVTWEIVEEDRIVFELSVQTLGFVGFGFSTNGVMAGADMVIGGVYPNTSSYLSDRHAVGNELPVLDQQRDYFFLAGYENSTHTYLKFSRLLDTCNSNDFKITENPLKILWCYGETDEIEYHGVNRGWGTVNLLNPEMPQTDLSKFTLWNTTAKTQLPAQPTPSWCTIHKTPSLSSIHYTIGFDAIIPDEIARNHTHQIEMFKCQAPNSENASKLFEPYIGLPGVDCSDSEVLYFPFNHCTRIQYGWINGEQITLWPENIGFQFLGDEYFMMKVYYDNPESRNDIQYETGMQVYYTEKTREITAAQFVVGSSMGFPQVVPPNSERFITTAHCHPDCANEFPEEGITVFNLLLHSHKLVKGMRVRHFRNGTELPWILSDDTYQFNYQQNRHVQKFKVLRGDHITLECRYDTRGEGGRPVILGQAINLCAVSFSYYPQMQNFLECNSGVPEKNMLGFFGIEAYEKSEDKYDPLITLPEQLRGRKFPEIVQSFNWTKKLREEYQRLTRYEPHDGVCSAIGHTFKILFPQIDKEYTPRNTCAPDGNNDEPSTANVVQNKVILLLFCIICNLS